MKREPKRYKKPFEIQSEILKLKRRMAARMKEADQVDKVVQNWIAEANKPVDNPGRVTWMLEEADKERKKAHKLRRSATIIEETKIPRLIRTLQELGTQPMEFIKDDISVKLAD